MHGPKPEFELSGSSTEDLILSKPSSQNSSETTSESSHSNGGDTESGRRSVGGATCREFTTHIAPVQFEMSKPSFKIQDFSTRVLGPKEEAKELQKAHTASDDPADPVLNNIFGRINREQFKRYLKQPAYLRVFNKQPRIKQFRRLFLAQELRLDNGDITSSSNTTLSTLSENNGRAVWATKFSRDGRFLATGGKDCTLRIWKVIASPLERNDLSNSTTKPQAKRISLRMPPSAATGRSNKDELDQVTAPGLMDLYAPVFHPLPYRTFQGHTQDILDLDWSKNGFILTTSMDKTARLWHCDRPKALKTFEHPDFVTCAKFHPNDDRFFLSGCLDHKLRLWSILDHSVSFEHYCGDIITAIDTSFGDGKYTAIGTFNGHISILYTRGLEMISTFHVMESSKGRIRKSTESGPKITGIEFFKSAPDNDLRIMVTSNDSRIRIFSVKNRTLLEVLRGFENAHSQISAHTLSTTRKKMYVIAPSENQWVYCWKLESSAGAADLDESSNNKAHRHGSIRGLLRRSLSIGSAHSSEKRSPPASDQLSGLTPSHKGKHEPIKNHHYIAFHAHHCTVTTTAVAPVNTAKALALSDDFICELTMALSEGDDDVAVMRQQHRKSLLHTKKQHQRENDLLEKRFPSMIEAIGTIFVSTDSSGVIRVFRSDISTNVRKKVLSCLKRSSTPPKSESGSESNGSYMHSGLLGSTVKAATSTLTKSRALGSSPSIKSLKSMSPSNEAPTSASPQAPCDLCGSTDLTRTKGDPKLRLNTQAPVYICNSCGNQLVRAS
ncbi:hypothetical protein ACU8KH_01899 [Lachancea thermotolerans]